MKPKLTILANPINEGEDQNLDESKSFSNINTKHYSLIHEYKLHIALTTHELKRCKKKLNYIAI